MESPISDAHCTVIKQDRHSGSHSEALPHAPPWQLRSICQRVVPSESAVSLFGRISSLIKSFKLDQ